MRQKSGQIKLMSKFLKWNWNLEYRKHSFTLSSYEQWAQCSYAWIDFSFISIFKRLVQCLTLKHLNEKKKILENFMLNCKVKNSYVYIPFINIECQLGPYIFVVMLWTIMNCILSNKMTKDC